MLSLNQILNEMKSKTLYFTSAYSINMMNVSAKEIEWGINFTYRDKDFLLIKPIGKSNVHILEHNFVIGEVDLKYPENIFVYMMMKECDNSLNNTLDAPVKIINPNISIFKKKANFDDIFIRLGRNKINMVKTINAK
ncbi:hypothetical protein [Brachyspira catarrhinii]|uniref:Uncharacterized protein n=1 Tax=Brachyspira catarrhinii TaxID=2528966 RepID=A0ABY2TTQ1_9SPIR|nr:hypothetical protein [Brachyspira catarrhinii]TKZ36262.1 hypothetical protein EZH24_01005 [Brachyspira catarrhinii]